MADETYANPLETPAAFDTCSIDGVVPPGLVILKGGGNRKDKFDQATTPNASGGYTTFKGQELSGVTYEVQVWAPEHFGKMRALLDLLNAARKKRPPKVLKLVDPRVAHNNITDICVADISPLERIGPARWSYTLAFSEFKKKTQAGGAPKRAKSEQEKKVDALNEENKALDAKLKAAEKGA